MKKNTLLIASVTLIVVTAFAACIHNNANSTVAEKPISRDSLVNLGKYLVNTMDCAACHTPKKMGPMGPEPDMDLALSGHPANAPVPRLDSTMLKKGWILFDMGVTTFAGPWGQSYAANLTSDETGIGNWTEQQFFTALRKGKWKGIEQNRSLMPPMPWQSFAQLKDQDIKAIFAYLKSTKPVKNLVPAWQPWNELK
jgi:mono/diheme cytochrome c family protein